MYKQLVVSGCSFTAYNSWAHFLAKQYNLELVNLAVPGAGNKHIADSLIVYLEQNKCNIDHVLIGVMWSGGTRQDWMSSLTNRQYNDPNLYKYTKDVNLIIPSNLLHNRGIPLHSIKNDQELSLIEIAYNQGYQAGLLQGLLSIIYLNSYLISKSYTFFQTHFFNPDGNDKQGSELTATNYSNTYKKFNIDQPTTGMLTFTPDQFLGNWAIKNNSTVSSQDHHPTVLGHKGWTETVLIPQLIQQKLLPKG